MHDYQFNQLISVLNAISKSLADIADSNRSITDDALSPIEAFAAAAITGILATGTTASIEKVGKIAAEFSHSLYAALDSRED